MTMWAGRHNYHLNSATVLRDVYRLTTMILGDIPIMAGAEANPHDPLLSLRNQFIEDEYVHLLVGIAIANRIQLEHMSGPRNDPNEHSFQPLHHDCGQLQPNVDVANRVPLTFSEACNKIIHAHAIVAQTPGIPEDTPVSNLVALRGQRRQETWLAHLDILEYARGTVRNFEDGI